MPIGRALRTALSAALSCLSSACMIDERRAAPSTITADDVFAAASRVVHCEWAAVYRFDSAQRTVADLAQQIMGVNQTGYLKLTRDSSSRGRNGPSKSKAAQYS